MKLFDKSVSMSLPRSKTIRGYEIKRAPLGAYLQAVQSLEGFPAKLMDALFPGASLDEIIGALKGCTQDMLVQLFTRALTALPVEMVELIAQLTGIDRVKLVEDADIGLDGLAEIVYAWVEVNQLENLRRPSALCCKEQRRWRGERLAPKADCQCAVHWHFQAGAVGGLLPG